MCIVSTHIWITVKLWSLKTSGAISPSESHEMDIPTAHSAASKTDLEVLTTFTISEFMNETALTFKSNKTFGVPDYDWFLKCPEPT